MQYRAQKKYSESKWVKLILAAAVAQNAAISAVLSAKLTGMTRWIASKEKNTDFDSA